MVATFRQLGQKAHNLSNLQIDCYIWKYGVGSIRQRTHFVASAMIGWDQDLGMSHNLTTAHCHLANGKLKRLKKRVLGEAERKDHNDSNASANVGERSRGEKDESICVEGVQKTKTSPNESKDNVSAGSLAQQANHIKKVHRYH